MAGGERALVRRVVDGSLCTVMELTSHQRGSFGHLISGGSYRPEALRRSGGLSERLFESLLRHLMEHGVIDCSNGFVTATPLGRFDILSEGSKDCLLLLHQHSEPMRASYGVGFGRHPSSFLALRRLASKTNDGFWSLTDIGRETATAVTEAGLA